ncbi:MAG: universal stress protein [Acidimicrobiales bacterium]|jgi:nucleotide-binding universal stress UspA family protein
MFKSVLVATDGSETASEAVRVATELAKAFGATLHVVNVSPSGEPGPVGTSEMTMALIADIDRRTATAESIASQVREQGVAVEMHVVAGSVAERVVAIAEEQQIELIVVGNKGMRGLKRVLGSVPNDVAHTASCAVLIVNTT